MNCNASTRSKDQGISIALHANLIMLPPFMLTPSRGVAVYFSDVVY